MEGLKRGRSAVYGVEKVDRENFSSCPVTLLHNHVGDATEVVELP